MRVLTPLIVMLVAGCGDLRYEETLGPSSGTAPGSTANFGSVAANIDGQIFTGRLQGSATHRDGRLSFSAYDGDSRQLSISVMAPGAGTFETGGLNAPSVSLIEGFGADARRWVAAPVRGAGFITVSFISADASTGTFSFVLFPDSASTAVGVTRNRVVSAGTFTVNLQR